MKGKKTEFYGELKRSTEKAVLIFDGTNEVWLPKSQIEIEMGKSDDCEITLPEWLALEKGII